MDANEEGVASAAPSTFAAAVTYVERHKFSVIPVRVGDKRPALPAWTEYQTRLPTLGELESWFGNGSNLNVGIVCGALSGLVVVDEDEEGATDALKLPLTAWARTPRGRHFYFQHPRTSVPPAVGVRPHVDVRGDGSYVVAPPSTRPEGEYQWIGEGLDLPAGLAPVPAWLLPRPKEHATAPSTGRVIVNGTRNAALTSMAGTMRRKGLSAEAIAAALAVENAARCQPRLPDADVRRIAASVGRYAPGADRPALRGYTVTEMLEELERRGRVEFLIRRLWPGDAYGAMGAQGKAGKTWAVDDLAVSTVTGTPWLNHFEVDTTGAVLMFVGEGGMRNTLRRLKAVAASRGATLKDLEGLVVNFWAVKIGDSEHLAFLTSELERLSPALVTIDPFYLSAPAGKTADLSAMGEALYGIQARCEEAGAALLIVPHWNKTGTGNGADRFTGVGPSAWGRVLGSASVEQRAAAEDGSSVVTLRWEFTGSEIANQTFRMRRRVWTADPADLYSEMTYEVEITSEGEALQTDNLRPAERRVLLALKRAADAGGREITVAAIGDSLARDGLGPPLKKSTIQHSLADLERLGLADSEGGDGRAGRYWVTDQGVETDG